MASPGERLHKLYGLAVWPPRIVALTGMWLLGTLAGLVVAGLAPATVAAHEVALGWTDTDPEVEPIKPWRTFWSSWKQWFLRSQLPLGFAWLTLVPIFFWAHWIGFTNPLAMPVLLLGLLWLITIGWLPPALIGTTDLRKDLVRVTLHLAWRRVGATLGLALILAIVGLAGWLWAPFALPFVVPGLPIILVSRHARRTIESEELRQAAG